MTNKRTRKKFNRATVPVQVGNSLVNVPAGQLQSPLGTVFYGNKTGVPVSNTTAFSPGIPLYPQPSVDLKGRPFAFQFPIAVNTFQPDRTLGDRDIPSFEQLRMLAKLYNGITLCERAWFDMVPRMKLNISVKPEYISAGADPKNYQTELTYFMNWFESPDKIHDLHSWIRIALREQTQIDELYVYKRRKRNGTLHALEIIDGSQMKPLLDDWGRQPKYPQAFVQQYPWGIPGAWFTTRDMVHYQETPRVESPYGMSRVERIIMLVNQALRKQKKDLTNFTDGNIPQGYMMVPETATWTPDQIDAFEQSWNALLAGNPSQQVRIRFTQPGMKYEPFEQYVLDPTFDKFLINICVSAYGLSMQDVAFTEDIHKSSGNFQENVTYRRTIDPLATIYAMFLTNVVNHEFPSELHGEMFQVTFGGYDEEEDVSEMAGAYTQLVQSGVLGVTAAGKLMKLPDDPNAPYIGRVVITKDGPVFLDDIATDKMRTAAAQAQLASFQAIATSPQQQVQSMNQQPANYAVPSQQKMFDQVQYNKQQPSQDTSRAVASDENQYDDYLDYEDNEEFDIDPSILLDEEFDPDQELENEIQLLLNSDKDEPYSNLERAQTGVDFSAKKNIIKAKALVEVAMKHLQTARKNFINAPLEHKDMAKQSILSARQQLHDARITLEAYKEQAKRIHDSNDTSLRASAIEERQHIIKIASAVKTKAANFVSKAQLKAQIAAANAAHATAKHSHRTEFTETSKNAAYANVIQSLVNTIASKIVLYNMLASRTVQKYWTKEDANESYFVSQDLKNIANLVIDYQDATDLSSIVNQIRMLLYTLLGQDSVSPRRLRVLEKLLQKLQITIKESENNENAIKQEKRYTISEIIELFSQQMQNEKANQKDEQDLRRSEESSVAETTTRNKEISADYRRWRDRAIDDVKAGRNFRGFTTVLIPEEIHRYISDELIECMTPEDVKLVFQKAKDLEKVEHL